MRLPKIFGPASVAALAAMAFMGIGSASATTVLCKEAPNPETGVCEGGTYPEGTKVKAQSIEVTLVLDPNTFPLDTIVCEESQIEGKVLAASGESESLPIQVISWSLASCFRWLSGTECAPEMQGYPWNGLLTALEEPRGDGFLSFDASDTVVGVARWRIKCPSGWTAGPVDCTFRSSESELPSNLAGGSPAAIVLNEATLSVFGTHCPSKESPKSLSGSYAVSTLDPAYASLSPEE